MGCILQDSCSSLSGWHRLGLRHLASLPECNIYKLITITKSLFLLGKFEIIHFGTGFRFKRTAYGRQHFNGSHNMWQCRSSAVVGVVGNRLQPQEVHTPPTRCPVIDHHCSSCHLLAHRYVHPVANTIRSYIYCMPRRRTGRIARHGPTPHFTDHLSARPIPPFSVASAFHLRATLRLSAAGVRCWTSAG